MLRVEEIKHSTVSRNGLRVYVGGFTSERCLKNPQREASHQSLRFWLGV